MTENDDREGPVIIEANASTDADGWVPIPRIIGPFPSREAATEYMDHTYPVIYGSWNAAPIEIPVAVMAASMLESELSLAHTVTVLSEVAQERREQSALGYTTEHDDEHGHAHLFAEAHYRIGHMGEVASPAEVRHVAIVGAALLVAAAETIDREETLTPPVRKYEGGCQVMVGGVVRFPCVKGAGHEGDHETSDGVTQPQRESDAEGAPMASPEEVAAIKDFLGITEPKNEHWPKEGDDGAH